MSGNPVSLAAGRVTLEILRDEYPYDHLEDMAQYFINTLSDSGIPFARARQVGSIIWPYFDEGEFPRTADTISAKAMERFTAMYWKLLDAGFYLPPSSYEVMFLGAAHSHQEVGELADRMVAQLRSMD